MEIVNQETEAIIELKLKVLINDKTAWSVNIRTI